MSHNAEIKLSNLYQFSEAFYWHCKLQNICPSFMFHHFTVNSICLMLFLQELKQVLVLVKQFSFFNRNVSQTDTIHIVQHFPIHLFATDELVKACIFSK